MIPAKTSAIIADYEQVVESQKTNANIVVNGNVTSSKYYYNEDEPIYKNRVFYTVRVTDVIRGEKYISTSSIIKMGSNCNTTSELLSVSNESECVKMSPKVGDTKTIYIDYIDPAKYSVTDIDPIYPYSQAIIYGDEIISVAESDRECASDTEACLTAMPFYRQSGFINFVVIPSALAVTIITTIGIVICVKKKKTKKTKKVLKKSK